MIKNMEIAALEGAPPPDEMTLKKLYVLLKERQENGLEISPLKDDSDSQLQAWFEFVWERMSLYVGYETLTKRDFAGDEIKWGCLCWQLYLEDDYSLVESLIEWDVPDGILTQGVLLCQETGSYKDVEICTPASSALVAIGRDTDPGGHALAGIEGIAEKCENNLEIALEDSVTMYRSEHIIPRIRVIERAAIDRSIFPKPSVQKSLLRCWDRYDEGKFDVETLRWTYRAMRRCLHPNHTDLMTKEKVCARLIAELAKDKNNLVLIDGFFLLGILASFPKLRDIIGIEKGVEESMTILKNHLSDGPAVGVVTNTLSALGNIVLDHRKNDDAFVKLGGLTTVVWVLNNRTGYWGEINSAAALIANSSYKRDDIKALYGSSGGPEALAYVIHSYDGTASELAYRALIAIFKAIANLALYVPNVKPLIEGGLDEAFYYLLNLGDHLPDRVLSTSLLTLANLTIEYNPSHCKRLAPILEPLMRVSQSESRQDPILISLILETYAALCRLPENIQEFLQIGGVEFLVAQINGWGYSSAEVLKSGTRAVATVANDPESIDILLANDILTLLNSILNGEFYQDDTPVQTQYEVATSTYKALKKIVAGSTAPLEIWPEYLVSGGLETILWFMETLSTSEDDTYTPLIQEIFNVVAGLFDVVLEAGETFKGKQKPLLHSVIEGGGAGATVQYTLSSTVDILGLNTESTLRMINSVTNLIELESYKQNTRLTQLGYIILFYLITQTAVVSEGEMRQLIKSGELSIAPAMKRLSLAFDAWNEPHFDIAFPLFQAIATFRRDYSADAMEKNFPPAGELFQAINKTIPKFEKQYRKGLHDFNSLWKASVLSDGENPLGDLGADVIPIRRSQWADEPYPNGVQDLPFKDQLRTGGKVDMVVKDKNKQAMYWRANQSLRFFQWRPVQDKNDVAPQKERKRDKIMSFLKRKSSLLEESTVPDVNLGLLEFKSQAPVGKLRVTKGIEFALFREAAKNPLHGIRSDNCVTIIGGATEESPQGDEIGLIFKSKQQRDQFFNMLYEWKTALTS